jgi:methyltransferase (TIGR00027 family)
MVRGSSEVIVPRTVAIDDAVRTGPRSQVVILGAGLDGRAWRMPELAESEVFEVDQPASQRDKQDRAAGLSGAKPRYVPVDFGRDDLADALEAAGHRSHTPTTWIWEGVVPYLTRAEVATTLSAVSARSAAGSRMIVNYQAASGAMTVALVVMRVFSMTVRRASPWRNEPWRSTWTPDDMAALLRENGFAVQRDDNLVSLATTLCMPIHRRGSLENSRVAVADHE